MFFVPPLMLKRCFRSRSLGSMIAPVLIRPGTSNQCKALDDFSATSFCVLVLSHSVLVSRARRGSAPSLIFKSQANSRLFAHRHGGQDRN